MKGQITINDFPKLKNAYNEATENKIEQFVFNDAILLTNYAKYLIEYMEPLYKKIKG